MWPIVSERDSACTRARTRLYMRATEIGDKSDRKSKREQVNQTERRSQIETPYTQMCLALTQEFAECKLIC